MISRTARCRRDDGHPRRGAAAGRLARPRHPHSSLGRRAAAIMLGWAAIAVFAVAPVVRGIKAGLTVEESLRDSFAASLDDVMAAYGRAIGPPGLKQ